MSAKILLLEDDEALSEIISEFLSEYGYKIYACDNAEQALNFAYEQHFDIWIFDVKVPCGDGFSLLKTLRECGKQTPSIFITSLSSINDVQDGFSSGCDDYLKKPFELLELKCRIETLLKRSFSHTKEDFLALSNGLTFGIISQNLYDKNGQIITLTQKETKLLSLLLKQPNIFVSQEKIFECVWDYNEEPSDMSLRAYIKNLRKIIGKDSIQNQRNRGYCYVC